MTKAFALVGARVFDGERMQDGRAVVIEDGVVSALVVPGDLGDGIEVQKVAGLLAPGFIDVQVNGGGGVLFNDTPTADAIRVIGAAHRRFGTTGFLPTLITDTREKMHGAMVAAREAIAANVPGVLGVHIEGPFLNPKQKGIHDPKLMRPIEDEDIRILTSLGAGRTLVTLAPEKVPVAAIKRLVEAGVIVSAGHTAASYEELVEARKNGLRAYTHIFNAMPLLDKRNPGPVGAALDERETWCGLIADMRHVSAPALRLAIKVKGAERIALITDAMPTVGTDLQSFEIAGRKVFRRDGRLVAEDGTLGGSDLDMASAVRNLVGIGIDLAPALRMASLTPAAMLRLDQQLGRISAGYRASFVLLDDALKVQRTWIDGVEATG